MLLKRRTVTAILAAALTLPAFAEDHGLWSNLNHLKLGERIGVIQAGKKRIEGRFQGFNESAISVGAGQVVALPRSEVIRVYRRARIQRMKRALIGGAIGVAAGVLLTNTAGDRFRNEGQNPPAGLWIGGAAGIGAGIGALTGGGDRTVYERSGRP